MSNNLSEINPRLTSQPAHSDRSFISKRKSILIGFLAFLVLAFLIGGSIYQRYNNLRAGQQDEALALANDAKARLQESLAYSLSATKTLSFFIQNDGSVKDFDSIASQILSSSDDIDVVQMVPGGVIKYVYPLKGNESVLGYDILKDPARNKEALKAIQKKELFFAGPLKLRQGGQGVVGRLPIFRNGKFWGFTAVVIKMKTLLNAAGIDSSGKNGYYFQLSKINPDTGTEEFFIQQRSHLLTTHSVSVNVPNGEWKLSVMATSKHRNLDDIVLLTILGSLFAILGGVVAYNVSGRPKKLNDLVKERTLQLRESEENYKALFEKSPLPLWIYDLDTFKFLDVNDAAVNLYGYSKEEFLQMDILSIRHKADVEKLIDEFQDITGGLRESGIWTHLKKNREEMQVLVFSRNIFYKGKKGRLVLLMDVSDKIKVENELIKSEEKYRLLIEQASDGIILYAFDGRIISFNKAACTQTGYTKEEFEKLNLKDLFFEQGGTNSRLGDTIVTSGNAAMLYRKLKRKDGSVFTVELNTRMLPDGKILAIVRDVTERENITAALKESEEKFSKAFHSIVVGFAIYNTNRELVDINEPYAAILELPREQLLGKTSGEFGIMSKIVPRLKDAVTSEINAIVEKEGRLQEYEVELEMKNGETVFVLLSVDSLELNHTQHWLTTAINITAKKKADLSLQESEIKYRSLIEQASDGIIITNMDGCVQEVNNSLCRMGGYSAADMVGHDAYDFIPAEDVLSNPLRIKELKEGKSILHERRFLRKDGSMLDVEVNSKMTSANTMIGFIRDITERKMAEEAIRISEEKYRTLVEQASDAILISDRQGRLLMVNPSGLSMSQYTAEELKQLTLYDFVLPGDLGKNPLRFNEMKDQQVVRAERRIKRKDGSLLDVEITAKFISGDRFLAFVRDISERRKAEEELKKSNERFELIAQATNDIVWDHDFIKNETWGNAKLRNLYGLEDEDQKIDLEIFFSRIHPEERTGIETRMKDAISRSVTSLAEEFRFLMPDGEYRNFYDRAYIKYDETGLPARILGAMQDITERETIKKQIIKEKELSDSIINSLPGIFYLFTKDGKYLRWNKNLETVSGYSAAEISKLHPLDFFEEEDHELLSKTIEKVFQEGEAHLEAGLLLKNKQKVPFYFTGQAIEYEGQVCLMGVGLDFSDKEKARQEIRESEERYRALVEHAPEALVVMDVAKQKFVSVSESAEKLFKMSREELLERGPVDVSPEFQPDGKPSFIAAGDQINKAIKGEKPSFEWTHMDKEGNLVPCEVWLVRLPSENELLIRGSIIDITARKKAAEEIRTNSELLRELYSYLQNIREEERKHIAREIHDELGQQLTGLKMDLFWINRRLKTDDELIRDKMTATLNLIDATIKSVRKIATELRPSILDDLGLVAALEWHSEEFEKRSDIKVKFTSKLNETLVLPNIATALFRIYQELLTNVARHSVAERVNTFIYVDNGKLYLKVTDNGTGFEMEKIAGKKTLGIRGIEERTSLIGGTCEIKSKPGEGTSVLISVPLHIPVSNTK